MAKIDAIIFDWAGTTKDYGCYAPAVVFRTIFEKYCVPISMKDAGADFVVDNIADVIDVVDEIEGEI